MTLFHGAHSASAHAAHEGMCLTRELAVAEAYAGGKGFLYTAVLPAGLVVASCEGYDHDEDEAPADQLSFRAARAAEGIDLVVYDDEDVRGNLSACYRLVSARAVAACVLVRS